jgi:hypothetical protein
LPFQFVHFSGSRILGGPIEPIHSFNDHFIAAYDIRFRTKARRSDRGRAGISGGRGKRRAEQIKERECAHKADIAKILPRERTAFLLQCLETDAVKAN